MFLSSDFRHSILGSRNNWFVPFEKWHFLLWQKSSRTCRNTYLFLCTHAKQKWTVVKAYLRWLPPHFDLIENIWRFFDFLNPCIRDFIFEVKWKHFFSLLLQTGENFKTGNSFSILKPRFYKWSRFLEIKSILKLKSPECTYKIRQIRDVSNT